MVTAHSQSGQGSPSTWGGPMHQTIYPYVFTELHLPTHLTWGTGRRAVVPGSRAASVDCGMGELRKLLRTVS